MKTYPCKINLTLPARWLKIAVLVCALGIPGAQPGAQTPKLETAGPIHITADKLTTDNKERTAEFTGNVTAVQGDARIMAERLKLYYGKQDGAREARQETSIDKIEAHGDVRIHFDNRLAEAEQAVYTTIDRKLVLTGSQATVKSGQDVVMGSEIIFYRDSGQVVINSDAGTQVKAIIHSDQRGLN